MKNKDLIEEAYKIAKHEYKNKDFDFNNLCQKLVKKLTLDEKSFNEDVGAFYTDLLQDPRFTYINNNKWNLKENLTNEEYKRYLNSLYDYSSDVEEDEVVLPKKEVEEEIDHLDDEELEVKVDYDGKFDLDDADELDETEEITETEEDEDIIKMDEVK